MSGWTKRSEVPFGAVRYWSDIWDGPGWQVNLRREGGEKPYLLFDAVMPLGVPVSGLEGHYATLAEAQRRANELGPPDWPEWDEDALKEPDNAS